VRGPTSRIGTGALRRKRISKRRKRPAAVRRNQAPAPACIFGGKSIKRPRSPEEKFRVAQGTWGRDIRQGTGMVVRPRGWRAPAVSRGARSSNCGTTNGPASQVVRREWPGVGAVQIRDGQFPSPSRHEEREKRARPIQGRQQGGWRAERHQMDRDGGRPGRPGPHGAVRVSAERKTLASRDFDRETPKRGACAGGAAGQEKGDEVTA